MVRGWESGFPTPAVSLCTACLGHSCAGLPDLHPQCASALAAGCLTTQACRQQRRLSSHLASYSRTTHYISHMVLQAALQPWLKSQTSVPSGGTGRSSGLAAKPCSLAARQGQQATRCLRCRLSSSQMHFLNRPHLWAVSELAAAWVRQMQGDLHTCATLLPARRARGNMLQEPAPGNCCITTEQPAGLVGRQIAVCDLLASG